MNKEPKRLLLKKSQLKGLKKRIAKRALDELDWNILDGMADTIDFLYGVLDEKNISLRRLLKYMLGSPTESRKRVLGKNNFKENSEPKSKKPENTSKPEGHGRNGVNHYDRAERVRIEYPDLKPADPCPECGKGRVYEMPMPSVMVRVVADAPLKATVYELMRLRCNLCGQIFTPELPADVPESKYDDSVPAMIAFLRYGCGMPLNRLANLQKNLGTPMPISTQWDILDAAAGQLSVVHDELIRQAAQGNVLHNDDTTMKVLSFLNSDDQTIRKGIFTSGIVSIHQERRIALFVTGHHHAGENLNDILAQRDPDLVLPIQMCDALSRNAPKEFQTILCNCLVHARRNFVDIQENFPDECRFVIDILAKVYAIEKNVKELNLCPEERLLEHQKHSAPLMLELKNWCDEQLISKKVEPNSSLGKAMRYVQKHWEKLSGFLSIPGAPLDNNICERILKQAIIHRKNSLFFKTENGAHVGDLFMSLIHTCQMAGENPFDYLTQLLKNANRLKEAPQHWMPWNYRDNLSSA